MSQHPSPGWGFGALPRRRPPALPAAGAGDVPGHPPAPRARSSPAPLSVAPTARHTHREPPPHTGRGWLQLPLAPVSPRRVHPPAESRCGCLDALRCEPPPASPPPRARRPAPTQPARFDLICASTAPPGRLSHLRPIDRNAFPPPRCEHMLYPQGDSTFVRALKPNQMDDKHNTDQGKQKVSANQPVKIVLAAMLCLCR